ncbi:MULTISPECIES: SDR family oxidoreductase [unclassified Caballeronia]|uniref:SDR family oxidoreductase n=1 Tax=unclassified Caballeronia TaxID=2646786 RepID=UPI00285FB24C|nr:MULTISPECIES: SDR family oxidoreductase [unclassified Caballeronia]MDR5777308.1 SDR family oxidoreductase [Caballeronia sp. LZ002]MDR5852760.1 SDR family oxidoreductase [Caballeronia sp. LZ003]
MNSSTARTVLVTGAAGGIGAALARHGSMKGWRVIRVDLNEGDFCADLGVPEQRRALADSLARRYDTLDAVVCCAGIAPPKDAETIVGVNFFGTKGLLDDLLPLLQASASPRAVVVTSIASVYRADDELVNLCMAGDERQARERARQAGTLAYASSKVALTRWIRRTAISPGWADRGVLLNGVAPGTIKTAMAVPVLSTIEGREKLARISPLAVADYAEPDDIAPLLAFMASAENRFMVGQVPFADGGSELLLRTD